MTDHTEAARGPVRTGAVLSSTGDDAPAAPATSASGTGSIGAPAAPAPSAAATPQPAPADAAAGSQGDAGRGRRALLTALALRGTAASGQDGAATDTDRHRPGRPTLAVAGIAGLLLVAAPFGMSAAQEHHGTTPLDGDTASGTTQDHATAGSAGAAQPQAPGAGAGAGAESGSAGGAEGYVPQVLPESPGSGSGSASGDGGGPSGDTRGESGGGGDGGGSNGAPVPPGPTDDEDDSDSSGGGGDDDTPTLEIEEGSVLAGLLSDREDRTSSSGSSSGKGTGDDTDSDSQGKGHSTDDSAAGGKDSDDTTGNNDRDGSGNDAANGEDGPQTRSGGQQDDSGDTGEQTQPAPEPEPFRAVAGPGCTSEGARYQANGDNIRRQGPAGYDGAGCDDAYDVAPVSGDPANSTSDAQWTFWPGRPGATCTVKILVQNGPEPLWENGIPAHYEVFDADNSDGSPRGGFDVTQPDGNRYWAMTELEDVGESFTLRTTNAAADPEGGATPEHPFSVVEAECR